MNSFGILDFALPFGALALVLVGWMAVGLLDIRRAQRREDPLTDRTRGGAEAASWRDA